MRRAGLLFALALILWAGAFARDSFDAFIDATQLPVLDATTGTEVQDRDGDLLRAYTVANGRWRLEIGPDGVDPFYQRLLIDYEDKRFFDHPGVDARAVLRAGWQALRYGRVISGGSTLTMQVARLLEASGTGKMSGKLRQMRVALALERRLSKQQVLRLYLHLAPFGGNLEGVRAAALAYFGKEPARLTLAQSALLVAIPQSPEARRPDRAQSRAREARARVLHRALADGLIDREALEAAQGEAVPDQRARFPQLAPHLSDRARLDTPGLRLHRLTIERELQRRLELLASQIVAERGERLQIAIMAADHRSGEILASVGSAGYQADARQGFVDMTRAIRSPGSTLKPLVYGLAFDQGLAHPETLIEDRPTAFGDYEPQNFDRKYRGTIRLREALQQSLNVPVVALTDALGAERLLSAMESAGMRPKLPGGKPGLAIALGGIGVTLEDLVQLYTAIARGGIALPLRWRSEDLTGAMKRPDADEKPDETAEEKSGARILSRAAAWQVGDILAGLAPPPGAPTNRLAYKTGTSYGNRDTWAIGFDGAYVVGVWLGRADGTPVPGAFGGDLAAPVLFRAFQMIAAKLTPQPAPPPETLRVGNADLPPPLRHFRPRSAALQPGNGPRILFPPDGAEIELLSTGLKVRMQGGSPPFTWMADGRPIALTLRARETMLPLHGKGFVDLTVVDALGQSARAEIRLH
jgi:penicillin-binding protein 1C